MEKVTGIGGLFFRAKDPAVLGRWYQEHLGIALTPASSGDPVWQQEAGPTVFSPFPQTSNYFGDAQKMWMVNFRVHDLDKMAAQLEAAGIAVKIDPQILSQWPVCPVARPRREIRSNYGNRPSQTLPTRLPKRSGIAGWQDLG